MKNSDSYRNLIITIGYIVTVLLISQAVQAKDILNVTSVVEKEIVVLNESGKKVKKRIVAEKVIPGEEVIYTSRIINTGQKPVDNVVITNPVPEHTFYKQDSAQGSHTRITYSADGGKTYATADRLTVVGGDGKPRQARASEYTHIRWTHTREIPPGTEQQVSFRATLQ